MVQCDVRSLNVKMDIKAEVDKKISVGENVDLNTYFTKAKTLALVNNRITPLETKVATVEGDVRGLKVEVGTRSYTKSIRNLLRNLLMRWSM